MRYVYEEHALSVDISLDDNFVNENEGQNSINKTPFNVEFQYRQAGRQNEQFIKLNARSENGKQFKVFLDYKVMGEFEYQCLYVVNDRYNLKSDQWMDGEKEGERRTHSWMEGERAGEWSKLQTNSKTGICIIFPLIFHKTIFIHESNVFIHNICS